VNSAIADTPDAVNSDAYDSWLFKIKPADSASIDKLLDAAAYSKLVD